MSGQRFRADSRIKDDFDFVKRLVGSKLRELLSQHARPLCEASPNLFNSKLSKHIPSIMWVKNFTWKKPPKEVQPALPLAFQER